MTEQPKEKPKEKHIDVFRPLGLSLNREASSLLLRGLDKLEAQDKQSVVYLSLHKDLENIVVIWDRRIKNEKILQEQQRLVRIKPKAPPTPPVK